MDLLTSILVAFVAGMLGGLGAGFALRFAINLRCHRLEILVADTQRVVASLKGVEYGAARWKKREREEAELASLARQPAQPSMKFDNDWSTGRPE
jgi:hypothetical protein